MTYEKFLNEADNHLEEVVVLTVQWKNSGKIQKHERVNWDGRKGWTSEGSNEFFEIINCEWK